MGTKPELTKLTVNLIPKAVDAMDLAARLTGNTRTEVVNRAVQMYALMIAIVTEAIAAEEVS